MKITDIGTATLLDSGNCFNVRCDDGTFYHVANICYESFESLIKRGKLKLECEVEKINQFAVIIKDEIPNRSRRAKANYCDACCNKSATMNDCKEWFEEVREKKKGPRK